MVGAKQKVATATRTMSATRRHDVIDVPDNGYTYSSDENESDGGEDGDIPEKDEVEERLEQMLFGDDEGFQSALKSHGRQHHGMDMDLVMAENDEDETREDEDDEHLDDVADADVGVFFFFFSFSRMGFPLAEPRYMVYG